MNRPYTICYLNVSAEAHIDGSFGKLPEAKAATAVFRQRWLDMKADAILYGAVTMAMFAEGWLEAPPASGKTYDRQDYIAPCGVSRYYVVLNTKGTIAYGGPTIDQRGRGVHGVIHVLTEDVSDDYLDYLRQKQISYIFCGKERLDPVMMMEKIYSLFGVKKAIISGGAYADWTLLSQGLIDEIKTMFVPVVDGGPDSNTLFRRSAGMEDKPVALKLVGAEIVEGDGLLVTYLPKNAQENGEAKGE